MDPASAIGGEAAPAPGASGALVPPSVVFCHSLRRIGLKQLLSFWQTLLRWSAVGGKALAATGFRTDTSYVAWREPRRGPFPCNYVGTCFTHVSALASTETSNPTQGSQLWIVKLTHPLTIGARHFSTGSLSLRGNYIGIMPPPFAQCERLAVFVPVTLHWANHVTGGGGATGRPSRYN